jgi:hypothetical protein
MVQGGVRFLVGEVPLRKVRAGYLSSLLLCSPLLSEGERGRAKEKSGRERDREREGVRVGREGYLSSLLLCAPLLPLGLRVDFWSVFAHSSLTKVD